MFDAGGRTQLSALTILSADGDKACGFCQYLANFYDGNSGGSEGAG